MTSRDPELTAEERQRYARHLVLPGISAEGQRKLKGSSALVVGSGGLGSPASLYLAAAGVGRLGVMDCDVVDVSNLHRQILHGTGDIGRRKVESARARLEAANPLVRVEALDTELTAENALRIVEGYDVVVDGTDNLPTRYAINDACVRLGKPWIYGAVFRFEGQVSVFDATRGPCYRCLYPEPPPPGVVLPPAEAGVLGVLPGIVGTIEAAEALKVLLGFGETLVGRLLVIDVVGMTFQELRVGKNPGCPACGSAG